jgi:hypothetical protein
LLVHIQLSKRKLSASARIEGNDMEKYWEINLIGRENYNYMPFIQHRLIIFDSIIYGFWADTMIAVNPETGEMVDCQNFGNKRLFKRFMNTIYSYLVQKTDTRNISIANRALTISNNNLVLFKLDLPKTVETGLSSNVSESLTLTSNKFPYIIGDISIELSITPTHGKHYSPLGVHEYKMACRSLSDNKVRWKMEMYLTGSSCYLPIVVNSIIYLILDEGKKIVGIEISNGEVFCENKLNKRPISSPIADGDRIYYLVNRKMVSYRI